MNLEVPPNAPFLLRAGADALLFLHIAGGSLGIVSGFVALLARKGERLHRLAGTVFFVSMLTMSGIAMTVAPFLADGRRINTVAGVLTFYLVATAWAAVKRKEGTIGAFETGAIFVPVLALAAGIVFIILARSSPTGTVDGSPPEAFYVFLLIGSIAALSDLKVIRRGGISGAPRIARHLWRMTTALTIASGSFFLGQQKVMPHFMHGSPLLFVPVFVPLLLIFFWMIRVRLTNWFSSWDRGPLSPEALAKGDLARIRAA